MKDQYRPTPNELGSWVGPDITLSRDATVYGHSIVHVQVAPESLPPMYGQSREVLQDFSPSIRSRFAQVGLEPYPGITQHIADAILETGSQSSSGEVTKGFEAKVVMVNNSSRPIRLTEGTGLFRLFNSRYRPPIVGAELIDTLNNGQVHIEGEYGTDWMLDRDLNGIYVRISGDKKWVPPGEEPLQISDSNPNYRDEIDQILEDAPETEERILWISETVAPIILQEGVDAVIGLPVYPDITGEVDFRKMGRHIYSHFLEGGRTNWRVRVEVESPTIGEQIPGAIHLNLSRRLQT